MQATLTHTVLQLQCTCVYIHEHVPLVSGLQSVPSWQVMCRTLRGTPCPTAVAATAAVPRPLLLRVSPPPLVGVPEPPSCSLIDQCTLIAVSVALHHSEPVLNL